MGRPFWSTSIVVLCCIISTSKRKYTTLSSAQMESISLWNNACHLLVEITRTSSIPLPQHGDLTGVFKVHCRDAWEQDAGLACSWPLQRVCTLCPLQDIHGTLWEDHLPRLVLGLKVTCVHRCCLLARCRVLTSWLWSVELIVYFSQFPAYLWWYLCIDLKPP